MNLVWGFVVLIFELRLYGDLNCCEWRVEFGSKVEDGKCVQAEKMVRIWGFLIAGEEIMEGR